MKGNTMLSLNTLRASGMTALLLVASGTVASAADMRLAPPPPPVPVAAPVMGGDSGFYLRGDIGVGVHDHSTIHSLPAVAGLRTIDSSIDTAFLAGIGAGYQVNSWIRGDITGEYRFRAKHRLVDSFAAGAGGNLTTGSLSGFVGLANAYVDLGTWHRITPFVGAGIGMASMTMGKTHDIGLGVAAGSTGNASAKTQTRLAWALHAGLGYDLGGNWKAEAAYRYLHIGNVNGGTVSCSPVCTPYYVQVKNLSSHDLRFGMRYLFADAAPAIYAPGPLVRKY